MNGIEIEMLMASKVAGVVRDDEQPGIIFTDRLEIADDAHAEIKLIEDVF